MKILKAVMLAAFRCRCTFDFFDVSLGAEHPDGCRGVDSPAFPQVVLEVAYKLHMWVVHEFQKRVW
jgi:hypothetical protein